MPMTQLEITTNKIINLVKRPGYIYAFIMTVVRDCFYDVNNPEEFESRDKLITEELMTLLGFWLQNTDNPWAYPESFDALYQIIQEEDALMKEMHNASYEKVFQEMSQLFQVHKNGSNVTLSDTAKAQSIQEAIYYSGDSAYDYEYVHFLNRKYKYDREWLMQNRGFDVDEAGRIALFIKRLINEKAKIFVFPNRELDYKEMGFDTQEEFDMALTFGTYMDIINPILEKTGGSQGLEAISMFCDAILNVFSITREDLSAFKGGAYFLDTFSKEITHGVNSGYRRFGDYNILQETPIIKFGDNKYIVLLLYQLFVSLYETPYYWIVADKHYYKTAGSNRGKAAEDMVFELLEPVFGKKNVLRDIEIKDSKHHTITDIDTLCILGSKAICIQVKSKKLSQASRTGSLQKLTHDFKCAVQDAYEQGLKCRKYILNQDSVFFWAKEEKKQIQIGENIDDVYIVCVTSENYPALTHQVHELLSIKKEDPYPVVFSVFDLRLMSHYLDNPYKFAYYIRQRVATASYFYSTTEVNYLAYHLMHKLYPKEDFSREYLDNDFACEIDKDYYPYISGKRKSLDNGTLKNKWENTDFETMCMQISRIQSPKTTDMIFLLYDLSSDSRDQLMKHLFYVKKRSRRNNTVVNIRAQFNAPNEIVGITCVSELNTDNLFKDVMCLGELHKYHHKADKWLTLGVRSVSTAIVDVALYADNKWGYDPVYEKLCAENIKP